MIKKYRKKPLVIEAIYYDGKNIKEVTEFASASLPERLSDDCVIFIKTLEGLMELKTNNYLIKGIKGEFYPCAKDIFETTYGEVAE